MPNKLTTDIFVQCAQEIHRDKYDYSNVNYIRSSIPVSIMCPKHGEFLQTPIHHLKGAGCPLCANNVKNTKEQFIKKAKEIHGDKYDYSKVIYTGNKNKVTIICPKHGEFYQSPNMHLRGRGCKQCRSEKLSVQFKMNTEQFIQKAKQVHGNKYDYSKVNYTDSQNHVCIICPKHGEFYQKPAVHLSKSGCPLCKSSHMEIDVNNLLMSLNLQFNVHDRKTLNNGLELDFYIPSLNIAIECQGLQHFQIGGWGHKTIEERIQYLKEIQKRDNDKLNICKQNNITLIYYSNLNIVFPYDVITSIDELKQIILNESKRIR